MNEWRTAYQRYIGAIYRVNVSVAGSVPTPWAFLGSYTSERMRRSQRQGLPESLTLAPVRHHVDYALARRAVLRDLRTGKRARLDVCDAQPELLRAARNLGERVDGDCPVCGAGS